MIFLHFDACSYQNSFSHQFQICKQIDFSKRRLDPELGTRNAAAGFFQKHKFEIARQNTLTTLTGKYYMFYVVLLNSVQEWLLGFF